MKVVIVNTFVSFLILEEMWFFFLNISSFITILAVSLSQLAFSVLQCEQNILSHVLWDFIMKSHRLCHRPFLCLSR